ncbi:MAG: hypothetical protein ACFFDW_15625, partial [Candidatus Thorarchaeota archaeon]
ELLTVISLKLITKDHFKESEDYSLIAIEQFHKVGKLGEAAKAHREIGEELLRKNQFESASINLSKAAKLFKKTNMVKEIDSVSTPLLVAAKNQLAQNKDDIASNLITFAAECANEKDEISKSKILANFAEHAINNFKPKIAYTSLETATKALGKAYPKETKELGLQSIKFAKKLIPSDTNYEIGKLFIENAISVFTLLDENVLSGETLLETSDLYKKNEHIELARDLLIQVSKVISSEKSPLEFATKVSIAGKRLIEYDFINLGVEQLRKAVGSYIGQGANSEVLEIAIFCANFAKKLFSNNQQMNSKHLFITSMEFSSLVDLENQDLILRDATNLFLEINDIYSVKEFYDFAKNNLAGEKDYLSKLGRTIIIQGAELRDNKQMHEEAIDFIKDGIKVLEQVEAFSEAGEVAISQGTAFLKADNFIIGEELLEKGAKIFIEINDIERSGDAFLALTEINIIKEEWQDAFRQIELANKSYITSGNKEKLKTSLLRTAEIGSKAMVRNPGENKDFALNCFESAIRATDELDLFNEKIEIQLIEARMFIQTKDYTSALSIFAQIVKKLEQMDENVKSPQIAEELSSTANTLILQNISEIGNTLIDYSTGILLRLGQPIKASEVYMKACTSLLKMNNVVDGVKLVLLASDTLMVADEFDAAAKILEEISELLYNMKDYSHASIVTGQIVTVHQKTGNLEEQQRAINRLVEKATEVIKKGKIMEGEQLWEQASNYSISTNLDFTMEINNKRIDNLLSAGMYNSTNNAFKQILTILDDTNEHLIPLGDRITNIAANLFTKEDYVLSKNFIFTAVEYYRKAKNSEKAKALCLSISRNFLNIGDEHNCIELIDKAAEIANELEGAHEAAKTYLISGFTLIETQHFDSGRLSIKKAAEIEKQAQNIVGCIELGELCYHKATEVSRSNITNAIEIYISGVFLFETADSFTRAGDLCTIVSSLHFNQNKIDDAIVCAERAVDYYMKDNNLDAAIVSAKNIIDSSQKLMDKNELNDAVLILERGRVLVEKIGQYDLLDLIISIYLSATNQNLPNRKSSIGIFFLNRAIDLAKSSPNPEENRKIINLSINIALEVIKKKNSLAGAKVLEIISQHPFALELMTEEIAQAYLDAIKLTIDTEWNMIGKVIKDAIQYFIKLNKNDKIVQIISMLTKRGNADLLTDKSILGFFFLDYAIRIARELNNIDHLAFIATECYNQLLILDPEIDLQISYRLLGYCFRLYSEINRSESILKIGEEFVRIGSKDLVNDFHSIRGYESLLIARDIAVATQNDILMTKVVMALLDFGRQLFSENPNTTLSTLEDIVTGLEAYQVPNSSPAIV